MKNELLEKIMFNIIQGRMEAEDEGVDEGLDGQPAVTELIQEAVAKNIDPQQIVTECLTPAMDEVGKKFEQGEYLIPDMLAAAECVGTAMELLGPSLSKAGIQSKGKLVLATVAGDLHDIGKNIVAIMLKGAGYEVIDLGTDVSRDRIITEVKNSGASYLGLSALLTTTMREMESVITGLADAGLRNNVKVMIGGAPTSKEFAEQIGADAYCEDAFEAVTRLNALTA
jgi:5-methyltetrahydrofolate--homocysteine methyltransferase